ASGPAAFGERAVGAARTRRIDRGHSRQIVARLGAAARGAPGDGRRNRPNAVRRRRHSREARNPVAGIAREQAMTAPAKTAHELIAECQGLVRALAWKIHRGLPSNVDSEDLIAYGQLGLAEAARDFDASRTGAFSTYAYYRIRGAIYDGLSKMSWFSLARYARLRYAQRANELLAAENDAAQSGERRVEDDVRWFRGLVSGLAVAYL